MDRNYIIGLVLIGLILITFSYIYTPEPPPKKQQKRPKADTVQPQEKPGPKSRPKPQKPVETEDEQWGEGGLQASEAKKGKLPELFQPFTAGEKKTVTLENDIMTVHLTTRGGMVSYVELKDYKRHDSSSLILVQPSSLQFGYHFFYKNRRVNTEELYFQTDETNITVSEDEEKTVSLKLPLGDETYIEQRYTIRGNSYMLDYDLNLVGFNNLLPRNVTYFDMEWVQKILKQEKSLKNERDNSTVFYKYTQDDPEELSSRESDSEDLTSSIKWASFKQQYFNSTLIADKTFDRGTVETIQNEGLPYVELQKGVFTIPFEHKPIQSYGMQLYFGPNHYRTLKQYHLELEEMIPLGWTIFRWVNTLIIIPVFNKLSGFIGNYGIIILLLTIGIKLILSPFTYKSYMSQAKMRALKPDIEKIKKKHGKNMQKVQMDQMALYRKAGVSPLGGCLPMLFQFPILIAMFRFFPASIELRQKSFLWADDLSTYDSIWNFPGDFSIPFYGDHVSLFTLLMALSMLLYSWYNSKFQPQSSDQMAKQMKIMTYFMPIFLLFIFNSFSAGLSAYYFFYNILSFGQTYLFRVFVDEEKIRRKIEERKKKPGKAKRSGFQKKLEDMAKKQQEMKRSKR